MLVFGPSQNEGGIMGVGGLPLDQKINCCAVCEALTFKKSTGITANYAAKKAFWCEKKTRGRSIPKPVSL